MLRRHGDEVERLPGGYYIALGRCDDTMNLGGIKVLCCRHAGQLRGKRTKCGPNAVSSAVRKCQAPLQFVAVDQRYACLASFFCGKNAAGRRKGSTDVGLHRQVSSVDLERVCVRAVPALHEAAAVGVPTPGGGPERLVLFVVLEKGSAAGDATGGGAGGGNSAGLKALLAACQAAIRQHLNPLFKVDQVIAMEALPRTASNKVMRRTLRDGLRAAVKSRL